MTQSRDNPSGLLRFILCSEPMDRRSNMLGRRHWLGIIACLLFSVFLTCHQLPHLPADPQHMGDSQDYLALAPHRPPVYGWVLAAYQWATGGMRFLPILQLFLMSFGLLWFAIELGLLLDSVVAGPVVIILALLHPAIHDAPRIIETESVFIALTLAGFASLFRAVRVGGRASIAVAAMLFALAAATRTTGTIFLLLPPAVVFFDRRNPWRDGLARSFLPIAAAVLVLLIAMAGNLARNGRFEIGSFGGWSVLGKGLTLIEPGDLPKLPPDAVPAAAATIAQAAQARAIIADAPDLASAMRAQMQTSEDLRYAIFLPVAKKTWPQFAAADWRERAVLVSGIGRSLILAHPAGYARLWLRDWAALLLYPNYWPDWATRDAAPQARFPECQRLKVCYLLRDYHLQATALAAILLTSLAGAFGGLVLIVTQASAILRRRADPQVVLFVGLAVALHASLLISSAAEIGFSRYTVVLHGLDIALVLWLVRNGARQVAQWRSRQQPTATLPRMMPEGSTGSQR